MDCLVFGANIRKGSPLTAPWGKVLLSSAESANTKSAKGPVVALEDGQLAKNVGNHMSQ